MAAMPKPPPQLTTMDEILRYHIDNLRRYGEVYPGAIRDGIEIQRHEEYERSFREERGVAPEGE